MPKCEGLLLGPSAASFTCALMLGFKLRSSGLCVTWQRQSCAQETNVCCTLCQPLLYGPELQPGGRLLLFSRIVGWSRCAFVIHRAHQYMNALPLLAWMHAAHRCTCFMEDLDELLVCATSLPALKAYCTALSPSGLVLLFAAGPVETSSSGQIASPADLGTTSPSQGWAKP